MGSLSLTRLVSPRARERQAAAILEARQQVTATGPVGWTIARGSTAPDYNRTGRTVRVQGWERHPVVHACTRLIVDLVSAVRLEVYRKGADGEATVVERSHPAQERLDAPRAMLTPHELRARVAQHILTYGNAFWVLERVGRRIAGIRPVHPEYVRSVYVDPHTDLYTRYDWSTTGGQLRESQVEDVVHFRDLEASPDGVFGYPRAAAALLDIQTDHEASQYVRQVVGNDGASGLIMRSTENGMGPEEARAARERWQERRAERGQRGSAEWIGGVDEVVQVGFSLSDLEFPSLRQVTREDICAVYGVDPRMIGIASAGKDGGLSGEQYREARFRLIQQSVVPLMKLIESTLDLWLMPEFGDVYVRFSPEGLAELTEDEKATSERVREEVKIGMRTVEEGRETVGLNAEMDASHHVLVPGIAKLRTVARAQEDADAETPEPVDWGAAIGGASGGGKPPAPDDGNDDDEGKSGPPGERAASVSDTDTRVLPRSAVLTEAQLDALWRAADERAVPLETVFARAARLRFDDEADGIRRLVLSAGERRAVDDVPDDATLDWLLARVAEVYAVGGDYHEAWAEAYAALIRETVRVGGEGVASSVGISFELDNPRVQAAIRRRAAALVQNVTDTTRAQLASVIETGRASGATIAQIADMIRETTFADPITESRALTIARTEVMGGLNTGEWLAATEDGVMRSKRWLSERGDNARVNHEGHADAGWVPIDHIYAHGMKRPHDEGAPAGEVVRCRCTMLYSHEAAPEPEEAAE